MSKLKANGAQIPFLGEADLMTAGTIDALLSTGCYWIGPQVTGTPVAVWFTGVVINCGINQIQILFTTDGARLFTRAVHNTAAGIQTDPWNNINITQFSGGS